MTGPLNGLVGFAHALRAAGVECGPGGVPVRSGIVAARPDPDRLIAGHSLDALRHLLEEVSGA
ncbi:hypothetical protein ACQPW3_02620 [Actinosynnema sp. CA-248983]